MLRLHVDFPAWSDYTKINDKNGSSSPILTYSVFLIIDFTINLKKKIWFFGFAVTFCYLGSQELGLSRITHPALSCSKVKTEATE